MPQGNNYPKHSCLVKRDGSDRFWVEGVDLSTLPPELYSCICKLKDYESSGMSPDLVCSLQNIYDDACETMAKLQRECDEMRRKLIELPIRPGDVVYDCREFFNPDIEHPRIKKDKVFSVKILPGDPALCGGRRSYLYRTECATYRREDFDKTVFLDEKKAKKCAERIKNANRNKRTL